MVIEMLMFGMDSVTELGRRIEYFLLRFFIHRTVLIVADRT